MIPSAAPSASPCARYCTFNRFCESGYSARLAQRRIVFCLQTVYYGNMKETKKGKVITLSKIGDYKEILESPMPGTMEERVSMAWELTREAVALGGKLDAEQRLQRHVTHICRA